MVKKKSNNPELIMCQVYIKRGKYTFILEGPAINAKKAAKVVSNCTKVQQETLGMREV